MPAACGILQAYVDRIATIGSTDADFRAGARLTTTAVSIAAPATTPIVAK
jgi:hypothetical protein